MATSPATITAGQSAGAAQGTGQGPKDLRDLDVGAFLDLLVAELQNQDPLSPMENSEMLQQISLIREISSTNELIESLGAVTMGQNLATAGGMIGKHIEARAPGGEAVEGIVDRVSIETDEEDESVRTLKVHVGESSFDLKHVQQIRAAQAEAE